MEVAFSKMSDPFSIVEKPVTCGHAVKVRQRCNRKRADVLVVIGFVFSQRGFRQAGLLRQLDVYKRQVHKQLAKVKPEKRELFEQRHSRELILYDAAARYLKELKASGVSVLPYSWICGSATWML